MMITRRQALRTLASVAAATAIAACGKKGDLKPPEGVENKYPRAYPKGTGKAEKKI